MMLALTVLMVTMGHVIAFESVTPHYMETGDCNGEQLCHYSYSAQQEYFDSGEQQTTEINATVDITCTSTGQYNGSDATLYCMVVKNPKIASSMLENTTDSEIRKIQSNLKALLSNWFCFVQVASGKIAAVYHPTEPEHASAFKKAIAAAFQANFKGTTTEEEIDPQSRHTSHYTHFVSEDGSLLMKRSVHSGDVSEYSTEPATSDIDSSKEEEIEYRDGKLVHSSGETFVQMSNKTSDDTDESEDEFSLSRAFSASGKYDLQVKSCGKVNKYVLEAQKKQYLAEIKNSIEETLKTNIDLQRDALDKMGALRSELPLGSVSAALEQHTTYGKKLTDILMTLMELEMNYGVLPGYTPAIDEILSFFETMPQSESYRELREIIFMLLSSEGSLKSQFALLNALEDAMDDMEANVILTQISLLEDVGLELVMGLKERLLHPYYDQQPMADQLLLVYATLAMKGSAEVEQQVMAYLNSRASTLNGHAQADPEEVILLLHALGNTGSQLSLPTILSFLEGSIEIRVAKIEALYKLTDDVSALAILEEFLGGNTTCLECINAVTETLHSGFNYIRNRYPGTLQVYIAFIKNHTVLSSLVRAVLSTDDDDLYDILEEYFAEIGCEELLYQLVVLHDDVGNGRRKRASTTNWDSSGSYYSDIDSLSNRRSDESTYPHHRAYLRSDKVGIDEAHIRISQGYFAGVGKDCDKLKVFGRIVVKANLLDRTYTVADGRVKLTATTTSVKTNVYVKLASNILLNYKNDRSISNCRRYKKKLAELRKRVFTFKKSVFVYVGYITLRADLYVSLNVDANANACIGRTGKEISGVLGALTPSFGVSIEGTASATLLEAARGGITVGAHFKYSLEPIISVQVCSASCSLSGRACVGLYSSWPKNTITLDTWYQIRKLSTCGSWIPLPCFKWGSRRKWDALSHSWSLGSQEKKKVVYEKCVGNLDRVCAAGALDSPLFSY